MNYENPVDEIKRRADIVEIISRSVNLKKAGRNFKGLCPFHSEKTPSFVVFPDSSSYHCFGCGRNGDAFRFLMDLEGKDFREVLADLARATGVALRSSPERKAARAEEERLLDLNQTAAYYFHQVLLQSEAAAGARSYLEGRGIGRQVVQEFLLGFAPNRWDGLAEYLSAKGVETPDALAVGLLVEREGGGCYDRFRARIMFPIRDADGRIRGFGGRSIDGTQPKYLNSPDSAVFSKGSLFYGMDAARSHIRATDAAVIVEGYTDVLMAHQAGFRNVIASMGTAIGEKHIASLKKMTKNFVLALDADTAGDMATLRGLEVIRTNIEHMTVRIRGREGLVTRGLLPSVAIKVVALPRGKDPCDLIREDPEGWSQLVRNAVPIADHAVGLVASRYDLSTGEGKSALVRELAPLISQIGDPVERAHYVQRVAHLAKVEENLVGAAVKKAAGAARTSGSRPEQPSRRPEGRLEDHLLAMVMRYPLLLTSGNRSYLAELLGVEYNLALEALAQSVPSEEFQEDRFISALGSELEEFARRLVVQSTEWLELTEDQLEAEFTNLVRRIERQRLSDKLRQYQSMTQEAEQAGDEEWSARLKAEIAQLASQMSRYDPDPSPLFRDSRRPD